MSAGDIRAAAIWAIRHGYEHAALLNAARAVERGELVVPGNASLKHPWSDVVLALHAVGVDVCGLKEARAA